jgi:hypothetical protein
MVILRRVSAEEHETDRTITFSDLLCNHSFPNYIGLYLYTVKCSRGFYGFQCYIVNVRLIK